MLQKFLRIRVTKNRSTHLQLFLKISALKNFTKFTSKLLVSGLFLVMICTCSFIKKDAPTQLVSYKFYEMMKSTFFTEHLQAAAPEKNRSNQSLIKSLRSIFCTSFWSTGFLKKNPSSGFIKDFLNTFFIIMIRIWKFRISIGNVYYKDKLSLNLCLSYAYKNLNLKGTLMQI